MEIAQFQRIKTEEKDNALIVTFNDSKIIGDGTIQQLGTELIDLVKDKPGVKLVLNFTGVKYLPSAALGKLITLRRKIDQLNGMLKLCEISPGTADIFRIAKLDDYFDFQPTLPAALSGLQ